METLLFLQVVGLIYLRLVQGQQEVEATFPQLTKTVVVAVAEVFCKQQSIYLQQLMRLTLVQVVRLQLMITVVRDLQQPLEQFIMLLAVVEVVEETVWLQLVLLQVVEAITIKQAQQLQRRTLVFQVVMVRQMVLLVEQAVEQVREPLVVMVRHQLAALLVRVFPLQPLLAEQ
jgi:hypothetical protein